MITFFFVSQITFKIGCEVSSKASTAYEKIEKSHAFISSIIIKGGTFIVSSAYSFPASTPILHAVFQSPPPDKWKLPLGYGFDMDIFQSFLQ